MKRQPTQRQKEAEFSGPHAPGKWSIAFPVPPGCTELWKPADWVRYAESNGGTWKPAQP